MLPTPPSPRPPPPPAPPPRTPRPAAKGIPGFWATVLARAEMVLSEKDADALTYLTGVAAARWRGGERCRGCAQAAQPGRCWGATALEHLWQAQA
jgi:hypothetical protein